MAGEKLPQTSARAGKERDVREPNALGEKFRVHLVILGAERVVSDILLGVNVPHSVRAGNVIEVRNVILLAIILPITFCRAGNENVVTVPIPGLSEPPINVRLGHEMVFSEPMVAGVKLPPT